MKAKGIKTDTGINTRYKQREEETRKKTKDVKTERKGKENGVDE